MPQIKLEYTPNINFEFDTNDFFAEIHQVLNEVAGIHIQNCKSRATQLDNFRIGDGNKNNAFVHLEVAILEGRTPDIKKKCGKMILELMERFFGQSTESLDLQITVEIRELLRENYFKFPEGTFTPLK